MNAENGTLEALFFETIGRLTPGALHELANPLLALVASVELALGDAEQGTPLHARLLAVHRTSEEIAGIVRSLQQLVRLRGEPVRRVELAGAADEAVALVRRVMAAPDVEVVARHEAEPVVREKPAGVAQALVAGLLQAVAEAERGDTIELVVGAEGGDGVVLLGEREVLRAAMEGGR